LVNKFKPAFPVRLYKDDPNFVSKDTLLIDRVVREHIDIGGVVVYAYRYLGTPDQSRDFDNVRTDPGLAEPVDIGSFLGIEDPVFLENRDRAYDFNDVPRLRGAFKVSQDDLIYGRFGAQGLNNDVYSIEFHIGSVQEALDRRFIIGDVLEFPHLKDNSVKGNVQPKLYEVARVMKSPTGWDAHYVNHVLSLILRPVRDQQEFIQFMERKDQYGFSLSDQVSTGPAILDLNERTSEKARDLAPDGPWDTTEVYQDPKDKRTRPNWWIDTNEAPDGIKPGNGTYFPENPAEFAYFLRTDFYPNRMFQFYNNHWHIKQFDKHLKWQDYTYVHKWQSFLANRRDEDSK
jgi:hypothetical protein